MKMRLPLWILPAILGCACAVQGENPGHEPAWWARRGVVLSNAAPSDYAPANQGQLKWLAAKAFEEMEARLPMGAGPSVKATVAGFQEAGDFLPVNQGQAKNVAAVFYDRLLEAGRTDAWPPGMEQGPYPWTASALEANDYAALNGGQLKQLFCFDLIQPLPRAISNSVDHRLAGKTAAASLRIYASQQHAANPPVYIRNTNGWAYDLDLTCISPWNSSGGVYYAGTLISPRHVLYAAHFPPPVGAVMRFISKTNSVVERTVIATRNVLGSGYCPDFGVGLLDANVPSEITFARVLPDSWSNKFQNTYGMYLPGLCLDQEEKALVTDVNTLLQAANTTNALASFITPLDTNRLAFYESKVGGDSGNPAFWIIDNQLVLLTVWTFGGAGAGTSIVKNKPLINQLMSQVGGGYQLAEMDLSEYPVLREAVPAMKTLMQDSLDMRLYPPLDLP